MRNKIMQRYCRKQELSTNLRYGGNFLYSDTKKFVYCRVPKVACKTWKKIIGYLEGLYESPYEVSRHQVIVEMSLCTGVPSIFFYILIREGEPKEIVYA